MDAMTDAKPPIAFSDAIQDLTCDLAGDGFSREAPIKGCVENGVRIITYSTDRPEPHPVDISSALYKYFDHATLPQPMKQPHEREAVRRALDEIEAIANIRFVEAKPGEAADIHYFKAGMMGRRGYTICRSNPGMPQEVFMSDRSPVNHGTLLHETGHALGLSHPERGGKAKGYTTDDSIMAGPAGKTNAETFGAYDIATLQYLYGASKKNTPTKLGNEALEKLGLHSAKPLSIRLDEALAGGALKVDLDQGISGNVQTPNGLRAVNARLTPGTQIADFTASDATRIRFGITGGALQNVIQGGNGPDTLLPRGGKDILRGGAGNDIFALDAQSKFDNIVTDFTAADQIQLRAPIAGVELRRKGADTYVLAKDEHGADIASLLVQNTAPENLQSVFRRFAEDKAPAAQKAISVDIVGDEPKATASLSGLPPVKPAGRSK